MKQRVEASRLVDTYEYSPLKIPSGEDLRFRLEIYEAPDKRFVGKLYRRDTFRLQATFGADENGEPILGDHQVLVREEFLASDDFTGESVDAILRATTQKIVDLMEGR